MRIIVGNEEDTPDWMVSDTSGAASRRTGQKKPEPETPERVVRGAQETQTILQMKQQTAANGPPPPPPRRREQRGPPRRKLNKKPVRPRGKRPPQRKKTRTR